MCTIFNQFLHFARLGLYIMAVSFLVLIFYSWMLTKISWTRFSSIERIWKRAKWSNFMQWRKIYRRSKEKMRSIGKKIHQKFYYLLLLLLHKPKFRLKSWLECDDWWQSNAWPSAINPGQSTLNVFRKITSKCSDEYRVLDTKVKK